MKNDKNSSPLRAIALVGTIGAEMAVSVIAGYWIGAKLDQWLQTTPWLMLVGVMVGLAVGIYGITLLIKQFFGD